eukprot:3742032-Pyramimonas_sp.AAC.1
MACDKCGQWEAAMGVFEDLEDTGVVASIQCYNPLLSALWRGGQHAEALRVFTKGAKRGVYPKQGSPPDPL